MNKKYLDLQWWRDALEPRIRAFILGIGFQPHVMDKVIEDIRCKFFIAHPMAAVWYGRHTGTASIEMRFVRDRMLEPGAKVIEVGAHHGYGTIPLSRWVGEQGRVYACEPMPENVTVIRRNLELNEIANVTLVPEAVGADPGSLRFRDSTNGQVQSGEAASGIEVRVTTVDELTERLGFVPDLIKMDVEGYEVGVLEGARRTLARHPALQIEVHPHQLPNFGKTVADLWRLIDLDAYEIWYQPDDHAEVTRIEGPIEIHQRGHIYLVPLARDEPATLIPRITGAAA